MVTSNGSNTWVMYSETPSPSNVPFMATKPPLRVPVRSPVAAPSITSVDDLLSDDERCCLRKILLHFNSHRGYYRRAIWLAEDASDRAARLSGWEILGDPIFDVVENTLVGVIDDCLAFPMAGGMESRIANYFDPEREMKLVELDGDDYVEQLLSFPTRGVFAEAKLGHCNASELIDPLRFLGSAELTEFRFCACNIGG